MILEYEGDKRDAEGTLIALLKRFQGQTSPAIDQMLDAARHALEMYRKYEWHPPFSP
jgi:hypothetical protein